jgi:hypothetical protein
MERHANEPHLLFNDVQSTVNSVCCHQVRSATNKIGLYDVQAKKYKSVSAEVDRLSVMFDLDFMLLDAPYIGPVCRYIYNMGVWHGGRHGTVQHGGSEAL